MLENTDEQNPMSRQEILNNLKKDGISCDRRTLNDDIEVLNSFGHSIIKTKNGRGFYSNKDSNLVDDEVIYLLMDFIRSAYFINKEKSEEVVKNLWDLIVGKKEYLANKQVRYFNAKSDIKSIFYTISLLNKALVNRRSIRFKYFNLDEKGNKIYRHDGKLYYEDPIYLVYRNDNYYLVCYDKNIQSNRNYRVDRMCDIELLDENISSESENWQKSEEGVKSIQQSISMFGVGKVEEVILLYEASDYSILDSIRDVFWPSNMHILPDIKRYQGCKAVKVYVRLSPTFWAWIMTFQGRIKILGKHIEYLKEFVAKNMNSYDMEITKTHKFIE